MLGDRRQPIPIAAIGQENSLRLRLLPVKQDPQGGPVGLRLTARNLADHAIGLMLRDEVLGPQIDLALQLIPGCGPSRPSATNWR